MCWFCELHKLRYYHYQHHHRCHHYRMPLIYKEVCPSCLTLEAECVWTNAVRSYYLSSARRLWATLKLWCLAKASRLGYFLKVRTSWFCFFFSLHGMHAPRAICSYCVDFFFKNKPFSNENSGSTGPIFTKFLECDHRERKLKLAFDLNTL